MRGMEHYISYPVPLKTVLLQEPLKTISALNLSGLKKVKKIIMPVIL